jgi:hypothetical protein
MLQDDTQVSDIQLFLNEIYGKFNDELEVEVILARMLESISDATSPFNLDESYHSIFVKTLSWYFAFCNRNEIDVQSCVVKRYPETCPKCISDICVCERTYGFSSRASHLGGKPEDVLSIRADRLLHSHKISPETAPIFDLNWFSKTLSEIYVVNLARWRVNRYYFPAKLLREAGKLANGYRIYQTAGNSATAPHARKRLENDAADFFAWLVGYWDLAASELKGRNLQGRFVDRYKSGCPYCRQLPCNCSPAMRRGNRAEIVYFDLLKKSPDLAREIERLLTEVKKSLEPYPELAKEFGPELKEKAAPGAELKSVLSKMVDGVRQIDSTSTNFESLLKKASKLYELIDRFVL